MMSTWWCAWLGISRPLVSTTSAAWMISKTAYPKFSAARWASSKSRFAKSASKKRLTGIAPSPSEKPAHRLEDIIEKRASHSAIHSGMDLDSSEEGSKTYDAERCLERISE